MKNVKVYEHNLKTKVGTIILVITLGATSLGLTGCSKKDTKGFKSITEIEQSIEDKEQTLLDEAIDDEMLEKMEKVHRYIGYSNQIHDAIYEITDPTVGVGDSRSTYYSGLTEAELNEEYKIMIEYEEEDIANKIEKLKEYYSKYKEEKISKEAFSNYIYQSGVLDAFYATNYFLSTTGYKIEQHVLNDIATGIIADESGLSFKEIEKYGETIETSSIKEIKELKEINDTLEEYQNPTLLNKDLLFNQMGYNKSRNEALEAGYNDIANITDGYVKKANQR